MAIEVVGKMMSSARMKELLPLSDEQKQLVFLSRERIGKILSGESNRKMLIIGPCSLDSWENLEAYAQHIVAIREKVKDRIEIILRFYPGKPRTVDGWKGLVYSEPGEEADIGNGIFKIRTMAREALNLGLPLADEMLNAHLVNYVSDYLSYIAIGARTTESQYHREVSSGLDIPVGFKNPTSGNVTVMANSIRAAQGTSHYVLEGLVCNSPDGNGNVSGPDDGPGNGWAHGILRGGDVTGPNYGAEFIEQFLEQIPQTNKLKAIRNPGIIIDTSHDNCRTSSGKKDPFLQQQIIEKIYEEIIPELEKKHPHSGDIIKGFMVESYREDGNQEFKE